jgi:hypothetical protein
MFPTLCPLSTFSRERGLSQHGAAASGQLHTDLSPGRDHNKPAHAVRALRVVHGAMGGLAAAVPVYTRVRAFRGLCEIAVRMAAGPRGPLKMVRCGAPR